MELNKQFDEQIKQKLENLEAGFDPASWELLAHRVDFNTQQEVDDLWKDKLGKVKSPIAPASAWEAFEQLIDAEDAAVQLEAEANIDSVAYERLHNFEVPYQGRHWALMAKRLEEEFSLRHKLYRYKVAEVGLMALLLLTFIRFGPIMDGWLKGEGSDLPHASQSKIENEAEKSPAAIVSITGKGTIVNDSENLTDKAENADKQLVSGNSSASSVPPSTVNSIASNSRNRDLVPVAIPLLSIDALPASDAGFEKIKAERTKKDKTLRKSQDQAAKLAALALKPVDQGFAWELPITEMNPFKSQENLRFSIFTTTDLNYVLTPPDQINVFDTLVQTDPNKTLASGYGGGVTVNFKKERWEFQTGGIYSFKRYIPNTPIFIFETLNYYIKEDFHGIQLDIFQVPLNANYHFKNTGNWRFYATAGASAHFIASSVYEIGYERLALGSPNPPSSPDDTKSIRQEKDFPDGLADGGALKDNFYMTANIGLGVERYVSPKWSVFFQPNYQHYLMSRGIGTNHDKIYTTSFHLGTKFNLK